MSDLNDMIDDVGVSCDFALASTRQLSTHSEGTSELPGSGLGVLASDLCRLSGFCSQSSGNSEIQNWRNNQNLDVVIVLQDADINGGPADDTQGIAERSINNSQCNSNWSGGAQAFNCGEYAIVRDDYAYSIRVFAHEVLHLAGARHEYAYGQNDLFDDSGSGHSAMADLTDVPLDTGAQPATTVMSNNSPMCSWSNFAVNYSCAVRMPGIASDTLARTVFEWNWSLGRWDQFRPTRYFPVHFPFYERRPYTANYESVADVVDSGMGVLEGLR
jgi:hypothetical protein